MCVVSYFFQIYLILFAYTEIYCIRPHMGKKDKENVISGSNIPEKMGKVTLKFQN
jgi:hypothetical protein